MIKLSIEEGSIELLDGVPEYVTFSTDIPSTVYYTLDGTDPSVLSLIAVDKVYLPTLSGTIKIKAIAIAGDKSSELLVREFALNNNLNGRYLVGDEGISVMRFGDEPVDNLSFDSKGNPAELVSSDPNTLDVKASKTNSIGEPIPDMKTSRDFINFAEVIKEEGSSSQSSPNGNVNFDPTAKFIIIDGSTNEAKENQVVKIVNRPYNTFGTTTKFYEERLGQKEPIVTGNYVRSFYNPKNGKYVSYYWESLESRWIRSEQFVEKEPSSTGGASRNGFVYRWVQDRSLSQLF